MPTNIPLEIAALVLNATSSKHDLAAWACTNKYLSDLALSKLWYTLDNYYILALCMPQKLWHLSESYSSAARQNNHVGSAVAMRNSALIVNPDDLGERFYAYANRIRVFNLLEQNLLRRPNLHIPASASAIDVSVLNIWAICSRQRWMFPNLHTINVDCDNIDIVFFDHLLHFNNGNSIRTINTVTAYHSPTHVITSTADWTLLFSEMSHHLPRIEAISLDQRHPSTRSPEDILWFTDYSANTFTEPPHLSFTAAISKLVFLRSISTCCLIPLSVFQEIACFPNLEYLRCLIPVIDLQSFPARPSTFQSLREVYVDGASLDIFSAFLSCVSSSALTSIRFLARLTPLEEDLRKCLHNLTSHPSRASLRAINLKLHSEKSYITLEPGSAFREFIGSLDALPHLNILALPLLRCHLGEVDVLWLLSFYPLLSYFEFAEPVSVSPSTLRLILGRKNVIALPPFRLLLDEIEEIAKSGSLQTIQPISSIVKTLHVDFVGPGLNLPAIGHIMVLLFPEVLWLRQDHDTSNHDRLNELNRVVTGAQFSRGKTNRPLPRLRPNPTVGERFTSYVKAALNL